MEKLYEGLFLLDANEAAQSWSDLENHIDHLLGKIDARIEYSERWSDKRLAYPVNGVSKGTYFLTYFHAPTDKVAELRRDAQISERILRLMVTREEWTQEEMNRRRDAAAQAREAGPPEVPQVQAEEGAEGAEAPAETAAEAALATEAPATTETAEASSPADTAAATATSDTADDEQSAQ